MKYIKRFENVFDNILDPTNANLKELTKGDRVIVNGKLNDVTFDNVSGTILDNGYNDYSFGELPIHFDESFEGLHDYSFFWIKEECVDGQCYMFDYKDNSIIEETDDIDDVHKGTEEIQYKEFNIRII